MNLLRLLIAAEAFVLFLDKKNQKSSHLRYASLPHEAIAPQNGEAPRAV
jgi:hypothetical protein